MGLMIINGKKKWCACLVYGDCIKIDVMELGFLIFVEGFKKKVFMNVLVDIV